MQCRFYGGCPQRLQIRNEVATLFDDDRLNPLHAFGDARGRLEADARLVACAAKHRRREGNHDGHVSARQELKKRLMVLVVHGHIWTFFSCWT